MTNKDENSKSEDFKHPERLKGADKNAYDKSFNASSGSQNKPKKN